MFCKLACLVVALGLMGNVMAISPEDKAKVREAMNPFVIQCVEEFGVSEDVVKKLEKDKETDSVDACFIGCVFKKSGMINEKGLYDVEKTLEMTKPFISNPEDMATIEKVCKECAKINDESVSDGDKGCDRSKLLFACMVEHKDEIDF